MRRTARLGVPTGPGGDIYIAGLRPGLRVAVPTTQARTTRQDHPDGVGSLSAPLGGRIGPFVVHPPQFGPTTTIHEDKRLSIVVDANFAVLAADNEV